MQASKLVLLLIPVTCYMWRWTPEMGVSTFASCFTTRSFTTSSHCKLSQAVEHQSSVHIIVKLEVKYNTLSFLGE
jgi:hypothetical protein